MKVIYMQRTIEMIIKNNIELSNDSLLKQKPTRVGTHKEQNYLVYEFDNKNYKKLEGWAHDYKDFRIGEVIETTLLYSFRVGYNGIPYIIKIFRKGTITNEYEMVLRDGMDMIQFGRSWVQNRKLKSFELTTMIFEDFIVRFKPKAKQTTGNTNFNNPF